MENETMLIDEAFNAINDLINKSKVKGSLILKSSKALRAFVNTANNVADLKKEKEILTKRILDLELEIKKINEMNPI